MPVTLQCRTDTIIPTLSGSPTQQPWLPCSTLSDCHPSLAGLPLLEHYTTSLMLLFSLLVASVGAASTAGIGSSPIKNHCGSDGVVPNSYMVTLKTPTSEARSAPTSNGLNTNKGDLSYLSGWFQQYSQDSSNRRKLEAGSNSTRAVHYFIQTQLAVAVEASDDVRQPYPLILPHAGPMSSACCPLCLSHCPTHAPSHSIGCHEHGYRPGRLFG